MPISNYEGKGNMDFGNRNFEGVPCELSPIIQKFPPPHFWVAHVFWGLMMRTPKTSVDIPIAAKKSCVVPKQRALSEYKFRRYAPPKHLTTNHATGFLGALHQFSKSGMTPVQV